MTGVTWISAARCSVRFWSGFRWEKERRCGRDHLSDALWEAPPGAVRRARPRPDSVESRPPDPGAALSADRAEVNPSAARHVYEVNDRLRREAAKR
ncbi:hypothetical protein [Streptomyces phaeochromogenes]|uniref:Transposase n=1 Tax=Streptomyces phaeochromogenes TaxID=1923 RepID=A0ABZ1HRR6_STRPH|nr:hypothetical protein [Streptomyces phaeochromogenes]WRZ34908.1 hypothetical protein OG931_47845 [Streptomyces phaeochromogenes]WSD20121.1 hypothetical protein OHB35_46625 [Streptomyces phaeochromogenes]